MSSDDEVPSLSRGRNSISPLASATGDWSRTPAQRAIQARYADRIESDLSSCHGLCGFASFNPFGSVLLLPRAA